LTQTQSACSEREKQVLLWAVLPHISLNT